MSGSGRRWVQCSVLLQPWCSASCSTGAVFASILVHFFKWTSLFILFVAAGLAAGAIRAFHEAGLWNHFQEIAFDMSAVLSTHSLFGTLMEGIFGYQEAPSVSEVAVWFIYLIPALVAFALPPRAGATASRSA
ncbi:ferrous iron permease efeU [Escherichia coli FVEC1412]|nr:ferrous iron permease efeU [Escherichia coli FVEC1412]